jgi:hypothetical protein
LKKILVVSYSQSGQLDEVINHFLVPFNAVSIERIYLKPAKPFPFPWTNDVFFDTMPECVVEEAIALQPFHFESQDYDLVIVGYQPWFLSPSLPITSLFQDPGFQQVIKGKPVVTIIAGRNMWLNAQESIKAYISQAGARLVSNIPLMDRTSNLLSAVTILHWMLTGRKDRKWGVLPMPGVSEEDIEGASRFGTIVHEALKHEQYRGLQDRILGLGLIKIPTDILFIEERAKKIFRIWAGLIRKKGTTPAKRKRLVTFFKYYLLIALFMVAPVLLLVYNILIAPFTSRTIKKKKEYFCGLETKA